MRLGPAATMICMSECFMYASAGSRKLSSCMAPAWERCMSTYLKPHFSSSRYISAAICFTNPGVKLMLPRQLQYPGAVV